MQRICLRYLPSDFLTNSARSQLKTYAEPSEITRSIRAIVLPRPHVYDKWCVQDLQHGGRDEVQRQADVSWFQLMRTMLHESHAIYNSDELSHGFPANVLLGDI